MTSGTDSSRWINRFGLGGRYTGTFAGLTLQGYGVWIVSGKANIAGGGVQAGPANLAANPAVNGLAGGGTAAGSLKYDGLSLFNGGIAATYARRHRQRRHHPRPDQWIERDGSRRAVHRGGRTVRLSYAFGPFSVGADAAIIDSQGSAELVHTSQRHQFAFAVGGAYKIAPGINLCAGVHV